MMSVTDEQGLRGFEKRKARDIWKQKMQEPGVREEEVEKSLGELYEHYDEIMHKLWTILILPSTSEFCHGGGVIIHSFCFAWLIDRTWGGVASTGNTYSDIS